MKVLLLCGVILAGALFAEAAGGSELCSLSNEDFKVFLKCMGDHVDPEFKATVKEVIGDKTDSVYAIFKKQCEAQVDFGALLTTVFSDRVAGSVRSAYAHCKPVQS
ncbi:uncharacterized protein LOC119436788 [Dermacentor silvarum]|uniref:uncharacterized protein LOC119436788 n=1 Tax=Dermacentor silvarum TaxID=543639 RepID=UPI001899C7A7|nr:uncharacterized protein LOC119436788 [Dermacentor silvarum]